MEGVTLGQLVDYLHRVENSPQILRIRRLQVGPTRDNRQLLSVPAAHLGVRPGGRRGRGNRGALNWAETASIIRPVVNAAPVNAFRPIPPPRRRSLADPERRKVAR